MVVRAKTKMLFEGRPLTERQRANSELNLKEITGGQILSSYPRRLVLELTNACNLNCVMCGRNAADFKPTFFDMDIFKSLEPLMDTVEEVTLMGWGEPTVHPHFEEMLQTIGRHSARAYFCTNGMRLDALKDAIFDCNVEVFAVSVDGASPATNDKIRRGSDLQKITESLKSIVATKRERRLKYPWINFVFCAMRSNLHELPALVRLAAEIGLEEVKAVYLTVFDNNLVDESLWGREDEVRQAFDEAVRIAESLGVQMKLPHIAGEDPAGAHCHKECFVSWRDFFVGSDGYVRPCMSTPLKFFKYDVARPFMDMWNDEAYLRYRRAVNDEELMDAPCRRCYQSSHCNWNRREAFIQAGEDFSPDWEK